MPRPADDQDRDAAAERLLAAWRTPRGWSYWSAVNNSEVGVWYAASAFAFMLFAGLLALLMRTQLAVPENDLVSADLYNQLYTLHGTVMMFLFAVPIFEALSIILLPEMLGARDLPFPRLSAYGFWCFVIGGLFVCGSLFFGVAPQAGWFMYPPLTTEQSGVGADIWLLGLGFIEIASIAAAVELIVGVLKCRPPDMGIHLTPLYAWYVLVVGAMIVFAFPPLIAGDLLFELERAFDWPFFDVERGGDPILWQHLFWIFGHPEVYIIFLPTIAIAAMVVPTFARRPIVGYSWVVLSAIGTGFLSFALWVHHMYTTGLPIVSQAFASTASVAVAIPTGIQLFAFIATLLAGRVAVRLPMLFVFGSIAIFGIGGLTGVMVAIAPIDWQLHDSYFVVAHLHYTLIGGMGFSVLAGVYYFYPFIRGRLLSDTLGRWVFWLTFTGFNVTFLPMHLTGMLGMPRRVFTYSAETGWDLPNLVSTCGAYVIGAGLALLVFDLLRPKRGPFAPRNPWNAGTLEWLTEMPGKPWGTRSIPPVESRYPLWDQPDLIERVDRGEFYLADAVEGERETLITTVVDAKPIQCLRVPGPSFLPMAAAAFTGLAFIVATFHFYRTAVVASVLAAATIMRWLWRDTARVPRQANRDVGLGLTLPIYVSGPKSCGWWAVCITMVADVTAFLTLVFAFFYYWTMLGDDAPPVPTEVDRRWLLLGAAATVAAVVTIFVALRRRVRRAGDTWLLMVAAAFAVAAGWALMYAPWQAGVRPTEHALSAMVWTLLGWTTVHLALGVVMLGFCIAAAVAGRLHGEHDIFLSNTALYWQFVGFTALVTVAVLSLAPEAW